MQKIPYSLFNFHSTTVKAVKVFLSSKKKESSKLLVTSLRISAETKYFFECLADAEGISLNSALINTLGKVKDQTIHQYRILRMEDTKFE